MARDSWTQLDRDKAAKIKGILENAKDEIIQDLPRVLRELKRDNPDAKLVPMHLEASPELLLELLNKGGFVATQLPNLQGIQLNRIGVPSNDKLRSIGEARSLYKAMAKGPADSQGFPELGSDHLGT